MDLGFGEWPDGLNSFRMLLRGQQLLLDIRNFPKNSHAANVVHSIYERLE